MNVLYDYQAFYRDRVGGVSRYFSEIITHMPQEVTTEVTAATSCNLYMKQHISALAIDCSPRQRFRSKALRMLNHAWASQRLKKGGYDIFHPTDFDPYYLPHVKAPIVATIHDMYWEMSHVNPAMEQMRHQQITTAQHIITVSEQTRTDLLSLYPMVDPSRVTTIHHGFTPIAADKQSKPLFAQPYLLFVGKRSGYKNYVTLLHAFAALSDKYPDLLLVCTGMPFSSEEQQQIASLHLGDRVRQVFANDQQLYSLYHHARCFVYPSEYEGFGIPILEAWGCECPVLLSQASCFPEIGGSATDYFETKSVDSLVEGIKSIIDNEAHRQDLIEHGNQRIKLFTWEKAANQTLQIYNSLL